jgi:hypothetical protein
MSDGMTESDWIFGHKPLGSRPNIRAELKRLRRDPLEKLLAAIEPAPVSIVSSDTTRYRNAYYFYYLSMDRYLHEMSVAARYTIGGLKYVRKYRPLQRRLAERYKAVSPFLEYDLTNCLLHSRILLDRVAGLARFFLRGEQLPSFTSFSDHKKFFLRLVKPFGQDEAYASYIRNETPWFDMPLKEVRDKFVVHSSPKHMSFLGYPGGSDYELSLNIMLPDSEDPDKPFGKVKVIMVSPLRLSHDLERFLDWFCSYGLAAINRSRRRAGAAKAR